MFPQIQYEKIGEVGFGEAEMVEFIQKLPINE